MAEKEEFYSRRDLTINGGYERGLVEGRHQALEWLLGAEWAAVEDDEEEFEEMIRADIRAERAVDGLHELLFGAEEASGKSVQSLPGTTPACPVSTGVAQGSQP
jgi:hypothetical protein